MKRWRHWYNVLAACTRTSRHVLHASGWGGSPLGLPPPLPGSPHSHSASLSSSSLHSPNCRWRWKMQHSAAAYSQIKRFRAAQPAPFLTRMQLPSARASTQFSTMCHGPFTFSYQPLHALFSLTLRFLFVHELVVHHILCPPHSLHTEPRKPQLVRALWQTWLQLSRGS